MLVYLFKVIMDILYAFHIEQRFPINMHITFANRLVRKNIDRMNITVRQSRQSGVARATCPD